MAIITIPPSMAESTEAIVAIVENRRANNTKHALLLIDSGSADAAFDGSTGTITIAAQTWATGRRVRVRSDNPFTAPPLSPLQTALDYFLIRVSATEFKLAATLADATVGTNIAIPTIGTGNYSLMLSEPSANWATQEFLAFEITHPQYQRFEVPSVLPAPVQTGNIVALDYELATIVNTSAIAFAYNAIALIKNGGAAGTGTGTVINAGLLKSGLPPVPTTITIAPGAPPRSIKYGITLQGV